jgi:hypothetical protein
VLCVRKTGGLHTPINRQKSGSRLSLVGSRVATLGKGAAKDAKRGKENRSWCA